MFLKSKKFMLTSLFILSSTIYADGLENSNTKHKSNTQNNQPTNSKIERKSTTSDSFERKKIYYTKYFKIYYDQNSVKQAQELIRVADQIAEVECKLFKMEIPKDIKVFVMDTQDNSNAFSTGYGIHLFVTNNGGITNEYKDYIPYLFSHELTHELLDYKVKENGINKYIPLSDGIVKYATIPRWWTEGMAVLVESMISKGGGRTFDPAFIAIAKRDLNEDKFRGLGPTYHNRPYQYGNSFMRFYLETYGIEKVSEAIDYYSKHKGGGIGKSFGVVAGIDAETLHKEWMGFLTKITNDVKGDLVEGPSIFDLHSYNAQVIKDGDNIWTYSIEKREDASVTAGHKRHWLKFVKIPFDDDGNPDYSEVEEYSAPTAIISNQPAIKGNNIYYASYPIKSTFRGSEDNIAYRYNVETGESTILKDLTRPDKFVNAGGKILYTFLQDGSTGISTLSNQVIIEPGKYSITSLSDAGNNKILFTAKVEGEKGSKIFLLDLKTKEVKFLSNGKTAFLATEEIEADNKEKVAKDSSSKEVSSKEVLYFTDNFGEEVNNVYKKDLDSNKVTKITNVLYNAKSPVVVNDKLVYLNYTVNNDSISTLDMKYSANEEFDLKTLEKERDTRHEKYNSLYGEYGEAYNPEVTTNVTIEDLEKNQDKEIQGFYFPDFTKPSLTLSSSGVGVRLDSANLNTTLLLSYEASSLYSGSGNYITPDLDSNEKLVSEKRGSLPLYWTIQKKDSKTDKYSLGLIHSFSTFSGAKFGYFHEEYITHGISVSNLDGKSSSGDKYRDHSDEMFLTIPFNIPALEKSVYISAHTYGDLQNDGVKGFEKVWDDKIKLEFGYDRYFSSLTGDAKTKFGMVIKNRKSHSGNNGTNYFYVDRDIKSDIPYVDGLSFLNMRSRFYFSPTTFSDNDFSLTQLTANGLGYYSVGGNSDSVRTFITNARFAGKIYGDMNYTIPIEKGSDFGMVYLRNLQLRLGYSYTGFMDEDYQGRASTLTYWKNKFPESYAFIGMSKAEREAEKTSSINKLETKYPAEVGMIKNFMVNNKIELTPSKIAGLVAGNAGVLSGGDPVKEKAIEEDAVKVQTQITYLDNAQYMADNAPEKEKKFRHGMTINPSVSLNGNLFNDSADFELSVGNTYMAEFTDSTLTDTDFWYVSAELRF